MEVGFYSGDKIMKTFSIKRSLSSVSLRISCCLFFLLGFSRFSWGNELSTATPFPSLTGPARFESPSRKSIGEDSFLPIRNTPTNSWECGTECGICRDPNDAWSPQKPGPSTPDEFGRPRSPVDNRDIKDPLSYEDWYFNEFGRFPNDQPRSPRFERTPQFPGSPRTPTPSPLDPEMEQWQKAQQKISFRYRNPVLMRFLQSLSSRDALSLYREINDLVDRRHLEPSSYKERVDSGTANLIAAMRNADFQQVNRIRLNSDQLSSFERSLTQTVASRSVQTREGAVQAMQRAMAHSGRYGLSQQVVAIEFIFGTTDTLDKYSAFVPDDVRHAPSASALEDSVVGIGVEVKMLDEGLRIERVLNNGPAHEAGLLAGDLILNADGQDLAGATLEAAVDLIGGRAGSRLSLGISRNGASPFAVNLIRRRVEIQSVSDIRMLDSAKGVGYLRLDKFSEKSSAEMDTALWNLHRQGMKSLVFDLRGNPGGLLTTATELSNKFLPQGVIVSTRGRLSSDNMLERATRTQTWKVPLVVLIDENSASASEIFAAAIQENGRGIIVGRKSYGKGTVQTHFPLRSVTGALRLTTARFYSPEGRVMAGAGVTPDVTISEFTLSSRSFNERDLDIAAALRLASREELAGMAARSAEPRGSAPGYSLSDRR